MLELAVDVALVASEPDLATRMWAFEESAKLKSCNRYRAFALKTNMANPNQVKMTFASRNEAAVKALRRQHWGTENHPPTWFGKPFEQVVAEADRRVGSDYEATYAKRYDELCWGTHGSTLAMIRPEGLPVHVIPAVACAAVGESSRLAFGAHGARGDVSRARWRSGLRGTVRKDAGRAREVPLRAPVGVGGR
jgi:hypothetical protein